MDHNRLARVEQLFHEAKRKPPDERAQFLDEASGSDAALRAEVQALLDTPASAVGFMESPAAAQFGGTADLTGRRLGVYVVGERIGVGGMGEVYQARDTKLGREVAIKVLPALVAGDPERLARFQREARVLASLNHQHIAQVYGLEESDGVTALVMELVEGPTLADRIAQGPIPVDEALPIAKQIAEALEAAHEQGIIHRDLKPANIKVRKDGTAKVLDFGLAKATKPAVGSSPTISQAPTITTPAVTRMGIILGTAAYMSPEQARGKPVDKRTDIWAFGCVLYEMLTGQRPFEGDEVSDVLARILEREPDFSKLPPTTPAAIRRLLRRCLEKDRSRRLADIADARFEIEDAVAGPDARTMARRGGPPRLASAALAVALLAAVGAGTYWLMTRTPAIGSVAVLPFDDGNADPDTEYLADGITNNLIDRLSQLPDLRVISRSAFDRYKGQQIDTMAVGRELGVRALLTGHVVRRNDTLTITLELVDATDMSRLWGQQYERQLTDLLALQREIPLDVTNRLRVRLSGDARQRLASPDTDSLEAHELYLKGRYAWELWTQDGSRQAVDFFTEAIRKDPNYALAYAGLADAYMVGPGTGQSQEEAHRLARDAVTTALSLDSTIGEAHAALASILIFDDWDFAGAEREFTRAIELSPSYGEAHHMYSHLLLFLGREDESLAEAQTFLELDPISESPLGHLAYVYAYSRRYDETIEQALVDLERYPTSGVRFQLADAYYKKGRYAEAVDEYLESLKAGPVLGSPEQIAALREAFARSGMDGYLAEKAALLESLDGRYDVTIAECHALLGDSDRAFEWLEKAFAAHDDGLVRLKEDIMLDGIRSDPRFADLQRRVGLPN